MPMHDWTRVYAGIYHAFHHEWISAIHRAILKQLPADYYCLPEHQGAGFGPDILTLKNQEADSSSSGGTTTLTRPKTKVTMETEGEFYLRKKKSVVIRHVSGDRIVAMIELVSPGNKNATHTFRQFVRKARELLQQRIHLLLIDPFPPSVRDPYGLHASIFEEYEDEPYRLPKEKPLTLISYECDDTIRTYLEPVAVGDELIDMPVYLWPGMYLDVPLERTYMAAWDAVPKRWQDVVTAEVTP
jgi:Protein of unknown function (DUF4058)